jgi:hypothetical protein
MNARRQISKQDAARRLINLSIYLYVQKEDALASHVVCQSADKLLSELGDGHFLEKYVKENHRSITFNKIRKSFNFLKHGKTDKNKFLEEINFVAVNELTIVGCCLMYGQIFSHQTDMMKIFVNLIGLLHNGLIDFEKMINDNIDLKLQKNTALDIIKNGGRESVLDALKYFMLEDLILLERKNDLQQTLQDFITAPSSPGL